MLRPRAVIQIAIGFLAGYLVIYPSLIAYQNRYEIAEWVRSLPLLRLQERNTQVSFNPYGGFDWYPPPEPSVIVACCSHEHPMSEAELNELNDKLLSEAGERDFIPTAHAHVHEALSRSRGRINGN